MKRYTKYSILFIMALLFCGACTDSELIKKSDVMDGIPVALNFKFEAGSSSKVTRSLTDEQERTIQDLYVFIFDETGNTLKTKKFFSKRTQGDEGQFTETTSGRGSVTLQTTSGNSLIYAVANASANQIEDLKSKLANVRSLSDLNAISITMTNESINRSSAALLMSGSMDGVCEIPLPQTPNGPVTVNGTIQLKRLDAKVMFQFTLGPDITSFTPSGWKVVNAAKNAKLIADGSDLADDAKQVFSSDKDVNFVKNAAGLYSFDYYTLENLKNSKEVNGSKASVYSDREREYKDNGGLNTGDYIYAPNNATFVEVTGKLELNGGKTLADVKYVIHLGYIGGDATDFNCRRNYSYTYNVQINGVNEIIVEAQGNEDSEINPGVEGDVVEATDKILDIDSHFSAFNIELNGGEEVRFEVITPFASVSSDDYLNGVEPAKSDIEWVHFVETPEMNTLASYSGQKYNIVTLNEYVKSKTGTGKLYFTVHVDDYYYDAPPKGITDWGTNQGLYWHHFVNKDARKMMIKFDPQYSSDKESSYSRAKYLIRQQSIQTCYNNNASLAVGLEHLNETGSLPFMRSLPSRNLAEDNQNGLANMVTQLQYTTGGGFNWNSYISQTYNESSYKGGVGTLSSGNAYAYAACLQRNRDENGNGVIDANELKWYMPARNQLVDQWIGARSLVTPMYDRTKYATGSEVNAYIHNINIWGNTFFVSTNAGSSRPTELWAAEGAAIGAQEVNKNFQVRCVRNLGFTNISTSTSMNDLKADSKSKVESPYTHEGNVVTMDKIETLSVRRDLLTNEQIRTKTFDEGNRPYYKFRIAANDIEKQSPSWSLFNPSDTDSRCKNYSERGEGTGAGKWRAPNQRELLIIYSLGYFPTTKYNGDEMSGTVTVYSRTMWDYDTNRYHLVDQGTNFATHTGWGNGTLRCVQDIQ